MTSTPTTTRPAPSGSASGTAPAPTWAHSTSSTTSRCSTSPSGPSSWACSSPSGPSRKNPTQPSDGSFLSHDLGSRRQRTGTGLPPRHGGRGKLQLPAAAPGLHTLDRPATSPPNKPAPLDRPARQVPDLERPRRLRLPLRRASPTPSTTPAPPSSLPASRPTWRSSASPRSRPPPTC